MSQGTSIGWSSSRHLVFPWWLQVVWQTTLSGTSLLDLTTNSIRMQLPCWSHRAGRWTPNWSQTRYYHGDCCGRDGCFWSLSEILESGVGCLWRRTRSRGSLPTLSELVGKLLDKAQFTTHYWYCQGISSIFLCTF